MILPAVLPSAHQYANGFVADGGSMVGGPPRVTWHTTESSPGSMDGVIAWLVARKSAAHLVWDPSTGEIVQLIRADRAARALEHPAGTPETNRAGAVNVQIEVIGHAADPFTQYLMLGHDVLLAWLDELGVPRRWVDVDARMSWAEWNAYAGHCGHRHVPGQTHTDPGAINAGLLLSGHPSPAPTPTPGPAPGPAPAPSPEVNVAALPLVQQGSAGPAVKRAQALLAANGYPPAASFDRDGRPDGIAGPGFDQALRNFQTATRLGADGKCGPKTWSALLGV